MYRDITTAAVQKPTGIKNPRYEDNSGFFVCSRLMSEILPKEGRGRYARRAQADATKTSAEAICQKTGSEDIIDDIER